MSLKSKAVVLVIALGAQPALAQQSQPNAMLIAQALDRCMATYAYASAERRLAGGMMDRS
jgi:hypothetical protein